MNREKQQAVAVEMCPLEDLFKDFVSERHAQVYAPGSRKVSLHFVELQFIVKGHESNALPGGVFDVRDLLAGVGIYDPVRWHPDIEDGLDLVLVEERAIVWLGKT